MAVFCFLVSLALQWLPLALSCGGGGGGGNPPQPPQPPQPCSWQTCWKEWRDDWAPQDVQEGKCTAQRRTTHTHTQNHNGQGSCPASRTCSPESQSRTKCSCRYYVCKAGPWSELVDLETPRPGEWASQQRHRDYVKTTKYTIRDNNCNGVVTQDCPGREVQVVEKPRCTETAPAGLQSGAIGDSAFSASSHFQSYPPSNARLNTGSDKAWYAQAWDIHNPWITVDLGSQTFVSAVATQGKLGAFFVKKYRVKYSDDNVTWQTYGKELIGNTNYISVVKRTFDKPLYGRYIRIEPIDWNKPRGIAMKLEIYKCTN